MLALRAFPALCGDHAPRGLMSPLGEPRAPQLSPPPTAAANLPSVSVVCLLRVSRLARHASFCTGFLHGT